MYWQTIATQRLRCDVLFVQDGRFGLGFLAIYICRVFNAASLGFYRSQVDIERVVLGWNDNICREGMCTDEGVFGE